ncbi:MAG: hypothetical protein NZ581_08915, partial [Candidatus Caldarchaeum sp.]|nr:hypothetical protein [Candidatus Caldarchaeum sp.]MDW8436293.1 hypothetical protein [Candidatus Caldarchaeum sp.]
MKRYLFICSKCGAKYRLQAWKAECPNCGAEFTLKQSDEKPLAKTTIPQVFSGIMLMAYVLYSFFFPNLFTSLPGPPLPLFQALLMIVAAFSIAGSVPFLVTSLTVGAAASVFHAVNMTPVSIVGLLVGIMILSMSAVALYRVSRFSRQKVHDVD